MSGSAIVIGGDYKSRKLKELTDTLNKYEFGDGEFLIEKNEMVHSRIDDEVSATVFAYRFLDEDYEKQETMTLKWLSENICPLLNSGTLEIVAGGGHWHIAYLERLVIHSNGNVQRYSEAYTAGEKSKAWRDLGNELYVPKRTRKKTEMIRPLSINNT